MRWKSKIPIKKIKMKKMIKEKKKEMMVTLTFKLILLLEEEN
jgi:hypothetical protein